MTRLSPGPDHFPVVTRSGHAPDLSRPAGYLNPHVIYLPRDKTLTGLSYSILSPFLFRSGQGYVEINIWLYINTKMIQNVRSCSFDC